MRTPLVLSVKDRHCIQTTRVICYRPINRLAINYKMTHTPLSQGPILSPPQCCFNLGSPSTFFIKYTKPRFYASESASACASASSTQSQTFQAETYRILIEHKKYKKNKKHYICNTTRLGHFYKSPKARNTLLDISLSIQIAVSLT